MRESFNGLGDLMGYYQYLKFDVVVCPTVLPQKNMVFGGMKPKAAQEVREGKLAFIGDIEKAVNHHVRKQTCHVPLPHHCVFEIFHFSLAPHVWLADVFPNLRYLSDEMDAVRDKYLTYGQLAKRFRAKKGKIPKRLHYRQNLPDLCKQIRETAEEYFKDKGFFEAAECA